MSTTEVQRQFIVRQSATGHVNPLGYHPCQGLYYSPAGKRPKTAFIATHYNIDFSEHYLGPLMAERGFGFLGWNTRFRGAEAWFMLEHALIDIASGIEWLRQEAGVESVVLLGNSGGASLMAAYQSQATEPNIRPVAGGTLPPAVAELPPADFYISIQAHPGRPEVLTAWMDPSLTDESDPMSVNPALDMFNADNGPPYAPEFVKKYRAAQEARNDRITDWVLAELERVRDAGGYDRIFNVYRVWADLRMLDTSIDPSHRPANQCYLGNPKTANYGPYGIGSSNTLRTWLSMWSLRTSHCRGEPHLGRITLPSLVIQSSGDAGVFPSDAQRIYDALASADKTLHTCEGDHYLATPANARPKIADLIAAWVSERGGSP
ncbi:MAG: alpha/beta hydrolase [Chloroflexi bacterium]|nr:alpha/beta hydrolase [Chloroflexota bacterium]